MPVRDNRNAENIDPLEMLPEDTLIQLIKEWETVASSETGDATSQELVDFESDAEENVTVVKGHEITAEMREWMLQRMESQMANIAVQNRNVQNPDAMRFGAAREERVQNMQPPDTQPPQGMPVDAGGMVEGRANMQPPSEMPDFDMGNRARGEAEQIPERSETITIYASMLALGLSITILKLKRKI